MHIFYSNKREGNNFILDQGESQHLSKVLRIKNGDMVKVIDGSGMIYECRVSDDNHKRVVTEIQETYQGDDLRDYHLHIAIAPTKSSDRFDWFVEKAVEIGVDEITPLICIHSERKRVNTERSRKVVISAMKQSLKSRSTIINDPVLFNEFLKKETGCKGYIAWCSDETGKMSFGDMYRKGESAVILIGPEGDFSPEEVGAAVKSGYIITGLGTSRLRTETAGLVACSWVYSVNH